ncbi:MAG: hypothetical protein HN909_00215 [Phycisphaerales bacterium]|jgi:nickel superoxide dismutase|nr:hypothetical protein [Phycisphaerales bacterium]MBT7170174.1 hypothetical protein [Phycisphaerales bacterium]
MTKPTLVLLLATALFATVATNLFRPTPAEAHCQIPCGIYNDTTRFSLLAEHITTIEKSMKQITALAADPTKNANQIARWVINKEQHADAFTELIVTYFLQQRIKPVASEGRLAYLKKIELCHHLLVATMKAKQSTDLNVIADLQTKLLTFQQAYLAKPVAAKPHTH